MNVLEEVKATPIEEVVERIKTMAKRKKLPIVFAGKVKDLLFINFVLKLKEYLKPENTLIADDTVIITPEIFGLQIFWELPKRVEKLKDAFLCIPSYSTPEHKRALKKIVNICKKSKPSLCVISYMFYDVNSAESIVKKLMDSTDFLVLHMIPALYSTAVYKSPAIQVITSYSGVLAKEFNLSKEHRTFLLKNRLETEKTYGLVIIDGEIIPVYSKLPKKVTSEGAVEEIL